MLSRGEQHLIPLLISQIKIPIHSLAWRATYGIDEIALQSQFQLTLSRGEHFLAIGYSVSPLLFQLMLSHGERPFARSARQR